MIFNVVASSLDNSDVFGFDGLIQNTDGVWVHDFAGNIAYSNILHVELMVLYHGLCMVRKLDIKDLMCYSDSNHTIKVISEFVNAWHHYATILLNIKDLLSKK